ncbi:unnamed protein product [Oreochromis niloticus]|nr:unnamed protein product [Mustela putorius furo]
MINDGQGWKSVIVKDGDDAILPCSLGTNENIEFLRFEWTKEGTEKEVFICDTGVCYSPALPDRVSHFRDDLKHGAAKPHVTSHSQIIGGALLQCDVKNAYPEPKVEWQDSDNQIIHSEEQVSEQGGRFNIILKATVTKTGRYHCVATQGDNHQAQKEIHVHLNGE